MNCYHCSPTPGLTLITPSSNALFDAPKMVYMSSLLPMALMYGIRHFEYSYGFHFEDGHPRGMYYEEYWPGALEALYQGKAASLYTCKAGAYQQTKKPHELVSLEAVPVLSEERVPDLLAALLAQERAGLLEIRRYGTLSQQALAWIRQAEAQTILKHGLLHTPGPFADYMRRHYPDSWQDALAAQAKV